MRRIGNIYEKQYSFIYISVFIDHDSKTLDIDYEILNRFVAVWLNKVVLLGLRMLNH